MREMLLAASSCMVTWYRDREHGDRSPPEMELCGTQQHCGGSTTTMLLSCHAVIGCWPVRIRG